MIKIILLLVSLAQLEGQVIVTTVGTRVKVTSTVNTLICSFDNIGGATTTIHINCRVPLGYILIETTTPRYTPVAITPPGTNNMIAVGGTVGSFRDDNNNTISWLLQQLVKGIINYQITDNNNQGSSGTFVPQTILAQLDPEPCGNCFVYNFWQVKIKNGGTVREKWSYEKDYYQRPDSYGRWWIAQLMYNGSVYKE
jgi:hypothetical protein